MLPSQQHNKKKAQNEANQEGLNRLWERYEKCSENPNSKMKSTVRKAIKSIQACKTVIRTTKEAKALHGIGDALARVIIKRQDSLFSSKHMDLGSENQKESLPLNSVLPIQRKHLTLKRKIPPPPPLQDSTIESTTLSERQKSYSKAVAASKSLHLPKYNWKVVLLVDGREHHSKRMIAKLEMSGVPSEVRHLPIGDMAWVAKSGLIEVMLGTIVERKEVHDLASSLYGTRYKEQRLRLQNCGLPQVFLLVEGDTKDVENCPHDTLQMAMMETRIELGFQVVQTRHLEDTVRFLKSVHRRILQRTFPSAFGDSVTTSLPIFSSPNARGLRRRRSIKKRPKNDRQSFEEIIFDNPPKPPLGSSRFITYQELKCKVEKDREEGTKTIHAIFCGMLKQIPKVSDSTVQSFVQAYPTPDAMFHALEGLNVCEGKNLLSDLGTGTKKVGGQRALQIYYTFMAGGNDDLAVEPLLSKENESISRERNIKQLSNLKVKENFLYSAHQKITHSEINSPKRIPQVEVKSSLIEIFSSTRNSYSPSQNCKSLEISKKRSPEKCLSPSSRDSWDDLWQNLVDKDKKNIITLDNVDSQHNNSYELNLKINSENKMKLVIDIVDTANSAEENNKPEPTNDVSYHRYLPPLIVVRPVAKKPRTSPPSLSEGSVSSWNVSPFTERKQQGNQKEMNARKNSISSWDVTPLVEKNRRQRLNSDEFNQPRNITDFPREITLSQSTKASLTKPLGESEVIELLD